MTSWINNISFSWFIIYICASDNKDSAIFHSVGRGTHIFPTPHQLYVPIKQVPGSPIYYFFPKFHHPGRKYFYSFLQGLQCALKYISVQFSSVTQSCLTLCDLMDCSMTGLPVHHQLPEFTQTHVHWVVDAIQPSHPLLSPSSLAFNPSQHQGVFQWVSSLHQVAKVMSFSFNISPSNEYSGLISFRMDWLDLLAVQGTLKSLLQLHSSELSILQRTAFFIV